MRKVKVTVPAACTNLGPGFDSLGLALALHNTVEMQWLPSMPPGGSAQPADQPASAPFLSIEVAGENAFPKTLDHPALQGAMALYKHLEHQGKPVARPMSGIAVRCEGEIPPECGLADRAAWLIGGLFAANNLLDAPLRREQIAELACHIAERPIEAVTALFGGLLACAPGDPLVYRRVELTTALKVSLIVPQPPPAPRKKASGGEKIAPRELATQIGRALLLAEALRKGDLALVGQVAREDLSTGQYRDKLPGLDAAREAAHQAGAQAMTFSGGGPALVAFAKTGHEAINAAALDAFRRHGVEARAWIVNVDTQGVAINAQK